MNASLALNNNLNPLGIYFVSNNHHRQIAMSTLLERSAASLHEVGIAEGVSNRVKLLTLQVNATEWENVDLYIRQLLAITPPHAVIVDWNSRPSNELIAQLHGMGLPLLFLSSDVSAEHVKQLHEMIGMELTNIYKGKNVTETNLGGFFIEDLYAHGMTIATNAITVAQMYQELTAEISNEPANELAGEPLA